MEETRWITVLQAEKTVQRPCGRRLSGVFLKHQRSEWLELSKHRREGTERSGKGYPQSHCKDLSLTLDEM